MSPSFERLEDRLLLTVSGFRQGNTLILVGDNAADNIVVTGTGTLGEVNVVINGAEPVLVTGIKHIKVATGGGNDNLDLIGVKIAGNLLVDMGDGDDDLDIEGNGTSIGGNVILHGSAGSDRIEIDATGQESGNGGHLAFLKNVTIDLGNSGNGGGDFCEFLGAEGGQTISIGGSLTVKGREGTQQLNLDSIDIAKSLKVDFGNGDDLVSLGTVSDDAALSVNVGGASTIKVGAGDDVVNFLNGHAGTVRFRNNLTIDLGADDGAGVNGGDALIMLADTAVDDVITIDGNLIVKGAAGAQDLDIDGVTFGKNVTINLGAGNDTIDLGQKHGPIDIEVAGNVTIAFGAGDDRFRGERVVVAKNVKIDGGPGVIDQADETDIGTLQIGGKTTFKGVELGNLV